MEIKKEMTLQELLVNVLVLPDVVEVYYCDEWHEVTYLSDYWVNQGRLESEEGFVYIGIGDNDTYKMPEDKVMLVRYEVDDQDIDNPHVPEDDFVEWQAPDFGGKKCGYFTLEVAFIGELLTFYLSITIAGGQSMFLQSMNTKDHPELADLYCVETLQWDSESLALFWDGLSVCQG